MKALDEARIVNALAVNKDATVELVEMNMANASDAHKIFMDFCNDQITLLICGQVLSSHARAQGLGSGAAGLQGQVREDIIRFDQLCLNNVLQHQLFRQYLDINGIRGNTPRIVWGGSNTIQDSKDLAISLYNLNQAGITVEDSALDDLGTRFGFELKRMEQAPTVEKSEMPEKSLNKESKEQPKEETNADDNKE